MVEYEYSEYGPSLLRLVLGALFLFTGVGKLFGPDMIIKMLGDIGFPGPVFFGWLLLLSEIIFGAAVLVGWKVKYTVWPLAVILLVATVTVWIPKTATDPMAVISIFFHFLGIASLISLALTGPGAVAASE